MAERVAGKGPEDIPITGGASPEEPHAAGRGMIVAIEGVMQARLLTVLETLAADGLTVVSHRLPTPPGSFLPHFETTTLVPFLAAKYQIAVAESRRREMPVFIHGTWLTPVLAAYLLGQDDYTAAIANEFVTMLEAGDLLTPDLWVHSHLDAVTWSRRLLKMRLLPSWRYAWQSTNQPAIDRAVRFRRDPISVVAAIHPGLAAELSRAPSLTLEGSVAAAAKSLRSVQPDRASLPEF